MIGYTEHGYELFEVTVVVLGYYDECWVTSSTLACHRAMGTPIYVADSGMLAAVLSKSQPG